MKVYEGYWGLAGGQEVAGTSWLNKHRSPNLQKPVVRKFAQGIREEDEVVGLRDAFRVEGCRFKYRLEG